MLTKSIFAFALCLALAISFFDCRSAKKAELKKGESNLIRLADLLTSESTTIQSHSELTQNSAFTEGWENSDGVFHAVQRNVRLDLPVPLGGFASYKIQFKARSSSGKPRNIKVMARKNQIAFLTLGPEWKEYEFDLPDSAIGKDNTNVRFVFNGAGVPPYADFESISVPSFGWGKTQIGNEERQAIRVTSNSKISFSLKLPEGNPHLFFGIAPIGDSPQNTQFFVTLSDSFGTHQLLSENIAVDPTDPKWKDEDLDLKNYAGKELKLELRTSGSDDQSFAAWSSPEIYNIEAPRPHLNVILFSIDTMRRDRVSYYGYNLKTTPNLDSLAAKSLVYQHAFCTFPGTLSSHTSVMTGLYVSKHQVARPEGDQVSRVKRIPGDLKTLAEYANDANYVTAGITDGGFVSAFYGFDKGFQQYYENSPTENVGHLATIDRAIPWLRQNKSRPFFLFLHTYRVHEPFTPPVQAFQSLFPNYARKDGEDPAVRIEWLQKVSDGTVKPTSQEKEFTNHCYDAEAFFFDQNFGALMTELKNSGLDKNTVILVMSDHGEQLFDRGDDFGHGAYLFPESIRVPLIVYVPGKGHLEQQQVVSLVDIFPTLANFMGFKVPAADGRLLPMKNEPTPNRFVFYETSNGALAWAVQSREFKMVLDGLAGKRYFYDIRKDPREINNLFDSSPRELSILEAQLKTYVAESKASSGEKKTDVVQEDRELKEKLKALGYIN